MASYQKFIEEKAKRKRELLGSMFFPRSPILFVDLSKIKGPLGQDLLKGFVQIHLHTIVAPALKKNVALPESEYLHYIHPEAKSKALEAADFVLWPEGSTREAMERGCVPIAPLNGNGTANYNPLQEKGNGFYFASLNKWEMFAAVIRALETYQFPYDWQNLIEEIRNEAGKLS